MSSKPMNVYTPIQRTDGGDTFWIKVGIARVNRDNSINIYLDALPVNGKLQLREKIEKPDTRQDAFRDDSSDEGGR
jgi:hypothetical protein